MAKSNILLRILGFGWRRTGDVSVLAWMFPTIWLKLMVVLGGIIGLVLAAYERAPWWEWPILVVATAALVLGALLLLRGLLSVFESEDSKAGAPGNSGNTIGGDNVGTVQNFHGPVTLNMGGYRHDSTVQLRSASAEAVASGMEAETALNKSRQKLLKEERVARERANDSAEKPEFLLLQAAVRTAFEGIEDTTFGEFLVAKPPEERVGWIVSTFQAYGPMWGCTWPSHNVRLLDRTGQQNARWKVGTDTLLDLVSENVLYENVSLKNEDLQEHIQRMRGWTKDDIKNGRI